MRASVFQRGPQLRSGRRFGRQRLHQLRGVPSLRDPVPHPCDHCAAHPARFPRQRQLAAVSPFNSVYRQAETGGVLLTGMGCDQPYPIYFDRILLNASQVTNPSIDPLREPMELRTFLGRKPDRIEMEETENGLRDHDQARAAARRWRRPSCSRPCPTVPSATTPACPWRGQPRQSGPCATPARAVSIRACTNTAPT